MYGQGAITDDYGRLLVARLMGRCFSSVVAAADADADAGDVARSGTPQFLRFVDGAVLLGTLYFES